MTNNYYLGVDIGSVSSNFVLLSEDQKDVYKVYLRTQGNPVKAIKNGFLDLMQLVGSKELIIKGVGATGSGRHLAGVILGADIIKNEITAHAIAAASSTPEVRTVIEIGGQDSKIILLKDQIVYDFAMNTVCAAGTGSFLDQQASRLNIDIKDFGNIAVKGTHAVRIAGRCGVFAESDMIHKQQMGYPTADILMGLCEALARNYLANLGKGKKIAEPIVFQGGVAANIGMKKAFEKLLNMKINIPENFEVMGALGAALLAKETQQFSKKPSLFKGSEYILNGEFYSAGQECLGCSNNCEVVKIKRNQEVLAYWGDRCQKWSNSLQIVEDEVC